MPSMLFSKPYYNVAVAANTVALEEAYNVYFEAMPQGGFAIRKRPGLISSFANNSEKGQGLYWSDTKQNLYYVVNKKVFVKKTPGGDPVEIGEVGSEKRPVVFAEGQTLDLSGLVYMASGRKLKYIELASNTVQSASDPNAPLSNFIANLNNRFFGNDVRYKQDFLITDFNPDTEQMDVMYWSSAVNPFRTTQRPDPLMGIYAGWNEVYLWGSQACEVWQEDGVTPVSPLVGSIIEAGCLAPYSVVMTNNTFFGLGQVSGKRAVIALSGRTPQVLSEAIANRLQEIEVVSDAVGTLCFVGGLNCYVLNFPTANQTWVYDFKSETWSQWSSWDLDSGTHNMFSGKFITYANTWNKHFAMSQSGDLYELSRDVYDDAGTPIRSSIRTGWIDHGTWDRKRSDQLIIKLQGYTSQDAKILLRWRSDGFPEWSTAVELDIKANSQNDHFAKLNRMGMYRSRQYEFIMTDAANLALIGMKEDVTRMEP